MKKLNFVFLIFILSAFAQCTFQSDESICVNGNSYYDGRLKGIWTDKDNSVAFKISNNVGNLQLSMYKINNDGSYVTTHDAEDLNVTKIVDTYFAELYNKSSNKYEAYKYDFSSDNVLIVYDINDKFPQIQQGYIALFETDRQKTYRGKIAYHLNNQDLFKAPIVFYRHQPSTVINSNIKAAGLFLLLGGLFLGGGSDNNSSSSDCYYTCSACGGRGGQNGGEYGTCSSCGGTGKIRSACR